MTTGHISDAVPPASHPDPFLTVRVQRDSLAPALLGICAGYELNEWRCTQLVSHLVEWLPEFALTNGERASLAAHNAVALVAKAARSVYTSPKYQRRGEPGELLLHVVVRQVFRTIPAICKYFFKDSSNDTVKGFDAVHVVATDRDLQLWLGEVKFYDDITRAIRDVVAELANHMKRDYLRSEFAAITNKIEPTWPFADRLKGLLHRNTPLETIFDAVCIPVLLTYDSPTIAAHKDVSAAFRAAFEDEVIRNHAAFAANPLPANVRIHLFLFPLKSKADLMQQFDSRLKVLQALLP
ncbi:MAG TPA: DUF1837 domain-containing protein [Kiritimatiellia bacterium]|nr:DUF1837 domain-containing protein [Kiritimatiellia bacterium]HMP00648.1 DUF1837 domain-containing protein [Kiritimatiellia bacterium]